MAYLAGRMINVLKENQDKRIDNLNIDDKDTLCVQIAALCYNLGECCQHTCAHLSRK